MDTDLRRDLVPANHIIERFHLSDAFEHVSVRIPGTQTILFATRRSPGLADEAHLLKQYRYTRSDDPADQVRHC